MSTNKDVGFYWAQYTCINCKTKMDKKIPYGKSIPVLSNDEKSIEYGWAEKAPECFYCGCTHWSHGKKPEV